MKILITGARAPIAADIARVLSLSGEHEVHVTDSLANPIGKFSAGIAGYHRLPAPAQMFNEFQRELLALVKEQKIERIIPTSEEVFWLAQCPDIASILFAPPFEALAQLHNKAEFNTVAIELGHGAGRALVISSENDLQAFIAGYPTHRYVLKPVYSRFGTSVLVKPDKRDLLRGLDMTVPWLAQPFLSGDEICLYTIANQGEVVLCEAYRPRYRAGAGASTYFEPVGAEPFLPFVSAVARKMKATGQLSFDVIQNGDEVLALECNPRGTSGVHLASQNPAIFEAALLGKALPQVTRTPPQPRMLTLPFLLCNAGELTNEWGRRDYRRAKDALVEAGVPLSGAVAAIAEMVAMALRARCTIQEVSTKSFEWNGPEPSALRAQKS